MFKTIVAGFDDPRGRGAVALGHAIAGATGAQLQVVGVQHDLPIRLDERLNELCAARRADLHGIRDELAPGAVTQLVIEASPARALRRTAQHEQADLMVVGSRQPGAVRRLTSGDTAMQVLHGAPCAVAVAPDALPPCRGLKTIGVGLNSTPEARAALQLALELAHGSGAELRLLAVASDIYPGSANLVADAPYAEMYAQVIEDRVQAAHGVIEAGLEACAGAAAIGDVRIGDPAGELVAFSADCDLLVLGSRRWGPVRRLVLGSTSEAVIRHAAAPVLVLPRHAVSEYDETNVDERSTVAR